MANEANVLFNFYQRYLWGPTDFDLFQSSLVDLIRGPWGAGSGASVLSGGAVTPNGAAASVNVAAFVAMGGDGYMHVKNSNTVVAIDAGDATHDRYDIIVARTLLTAVTAARPTPPGDTITLENQQKTQLVVIKGTPAASPTTPAKLVNDVLVCRVRVPQNWANTVSSGDIEQLFKRDVGNYVRFVGTSRQIDIRSVPGSGVTAGTFYGDGSSPGVVGVGGATGGHGLSGTAGDTSGIGSGVKGYGGTGPNSGVLGLGGNTAGVGGEFYAGGTILPNGGGIGDIAARLANGHLAFGGTALPASGIGISNILTSGQIVKAWARITLNTTTPVVAEGQNVTNPRYSGNFLLVDLVNPLASGQNGNPSPGNCDLSISLPAPFCLSSTSGGVTTVTIAVVDVTAVGLYNLSAVHSSSRSVGFQLLGVQ